MEQVSLVNPLNKLSFKKRYWCQFTQVQTSFRRMLFAHKHTTVYCLCCNQSNARRALKQDGAQFSLLLSIDVNFHKVPSCWAERPFCSMKRLKVLFQRVTQRKAEALTNHDMWNGIENVCVWLFLVLLGSLAGTLYLILFAPPPPRITAYPGQPMLGTIQLTCSICQCVTMPMAYLWDSPANAEKNN